MLATLPDVGPDDAQDVRDDWNRRRADGTIAWGPDTFRSSLLPLISSAQGRVVHADEQPRPATVAEKRRRNRAAAKRGMRGLVAAIQRAA